MTDRAAWRKRLPILAALILAVLFFWLNHRAYDGFFQDDELDNVSWAPLVGGREFVLALLKPFFDVSNFRPVGHAYFAIFGRAFGMDFPPYITPLLLFHLLNCALLFFLLRHLGIEVWRALMGAAFFGFSAAAMDAYWKPMYVFDLLCATFCLASILLFAHRRWILSFVAFWFAYKAKELAVMLPFVLFAYEYWFGRRRFLPLIPFFLASLSFGLQGIILNPNHDNEYTFRFSLQALRTTLPFYSKRFLLFPGSGLLLLALAFVRDPRVWFGLTAMVCFLFTLLFLPGRLFNAYAYLPLACATIALAAASVRVSCLLAGSLFAVWMFYNTGRLLHEQRLKLAQDDQTYAFVSAIQEFARRNPELRTLVYSNSPPGFHNWGVGAAWNIGHRTLGLPSLYVDSAEAQAALAKSSVAVTEWHSNTKTASVQIHSPGR